jgi:hypothetical protein
MITLFPYYSIDLAEDSERRKNNFNKLLQLSPQCVRLIQLMAFQYEPVTFYVTEAVEGHRLLLRLLECRQVRGYRQASPFHTPPPPS